MKPLFDETTDPLEKQLLQEAREYKASPRAREAALAIAMGKTSWLKTTGWKIAVGVAGVGALVGAWWKLQSPAPIGTAPEPRAQVTTEQTVTAHATISATAPQIVTVDTPQPSLSAAVKSIAPAQSAKSTLADEIAVIDRARSAVYSKDRDGAIRALDEYDRRFPKGAMAPEARTLRERALSLP